MNSRTITPRVVIADQPDADDLARLQSDGFAAVINLRHAGEPEQPIDPATEGAQIQAQGLDYLHVPIGGAPLTPEAVQAVAGFLDQHADGKVLVHCRRGPRAAALVLLHQAQTQGWPPEQAIAAGQAMGLHVEGGLRLMVELYLAQHGC